MLGDLKVSRGYQHCFHGLKTLYLCLGLPEDQVFSCTVSSVHLGVLSFTPSLIHYPTSAPGQHPLRFRQPSGVDNLSSAGNIHVAHHSCCPSVAATVHLLAER